MEAVDPVFQAKMLDMLKQTGRCACTTFLTFEKVVVKNKSVRLHCTKYAYIYLINWDSNIFQARNGCRLVSFTSRLWLLALRG